MSDTVSTAKFDVVESPSQENLASLTSLIKGYIAAKNIDPDGKFVYSTVPTLGGYKLTIMGRCQAKQRDNIEAFCMGAAAQAALAV